MSTAVDVSRQVTERPATALDEGFFRRVFVADRLPDFLAALPSAQAEALAADQFRLQTTGYARAHPDADHQVVLWRGRPVGRVITAVVGSHLQVIDIVLEPESRGIGIGTAVLRRVQERARAAGQPVRLHVVLGSAAVRWYESLGFRALGGDGARLEMVWTP